MLKLVLDVEVGWVVEHCHNLLAVIELVAPIGDVVHVAIWGDGDGVEWDWLGGFWDGRWTAGSNFGHRCCIECLVVG